MQAFDFNTPNTKYSLLLTPVQSTVDTSDAELHFAPGPAEVDDPCFFQFSFARLPPKEAEVDYKLRVDMQPLKVVYNENIVARICTRHSLLLHKLLFLPSLSLSRSLARSLSETKPVVI
jgi:hypothetical protein